MLGSDVKQRVATANKLRIAEPHKWGRSVVLGCRIFESGPVVTEKPLAELVSRVKGVLVELTVNARINERLRSLQGPLVERARGEPRHREAHRSAGICRQRWPLRV